MQLTRYTDYSLRVLLYLALVKREATIAEIADSYGISQNHLVKVVHHLGQAGFIITRRGRSGGIQLAREPEEITVGDVVREVELHFHWVECFDEENGTCPIRGVCGLEDILREAQDAFFETLDGVTVADCMSRPRELKRRLGV